MTIEDIKSLMKSGDVAGAEAAAQELLTAEPDNLQSMILYGTCRQLQGDEATFRDVYRAVKEHLDAKPDALDAETNAAWKRFDELYAKLDQPELRRRGSAPRKSAMSEYAIIAALIVAALVTGAWLFGGQIMGMFGTACCAAVIHGDCCAVDAYWLKEKNQVGTDAENNWTTYGGKGSAAIE